MSFDPKAARTAYERDGFIVLPGLLDTDTLRRLRALAERAREIARGQHGGQVQRIPPPDLLDSVDLAPYRAALAAAQPLVTAVLGEDREVGFDTVSGRRRPYHYPTILFEPAEMPWCTFWHRDWRDNMRHLDGMVEAWTPVSRDPRLFVQMNWPLYEDASTWIVPGSHARDDLPGEYAVHQAHAALSRVDGDAAERELACLAYMRSMPGAHQVLLGPGDLLIYRNATWHAGNYVPYRQRATLHDGVFTEAFYEWTARWQAVDAAAS